MGEVLLPVSVEAMLEKICREQNQQPPDNYVRTRLAEVGEAESLRILEGISRSKIRKTLSAFIVYMIKNAHGSPVSPAGSVNNWARSSPASSYTSSSSSCFTSPPPSGGTCNSPFRRHQRLSPSSCVTRRNLLFDDQTSPLFNHQNGADFREGSSFNEAELRNSASPLFSHRNRADFRLNFSNNEAKPRNGASSLFNHRNGADFMVNSSTSEAESGNHASTLFNHCNGAHSRKGSITDEVEFENGASPLSNHQKEADFRMSSSTKAESGNGTSPMYNYHNGDDFRARSSMNEAESRNVTSGQGVNSQLLDLDQLEFRKFFLILSYIGKNKLEEVMIPADVDNILRWKDSTMAIFESHIWSLYGRDLCEESDRLHCVNWDSGKTHQYYCYIYPDGSRIFKGPYLNAAGTHLQRELGDGNVLIVKLLQEGTYCSKAIIEEGILVGLSCFRFFVYKDGGQERKKKKSVAKTETFVKCYFVRMESLRPFHERESYILSRKTVHEARCLFMHVHTVDKMAKYMARFSLILSKTVKLPIDLDSVHVQTIEDDKNEDKQPVILTDGTGYISQDLAAKCPNNFYKEKHSKDKYLNSLNAGTRSMGIGGIGAQNLEPPLLMQCRLFHNGRGVKGTLLVNLMLPPRTIQIRESMIKVKADPSLECLQTFNSLEIVAISHKPKRTVLSKNLIALLSYGGVPAEYFLNLLMSALEETQNIYTDERTAIKVAENYADRDDVSIARNMLWADIPLNEPYLHRCLSTMAKQERNGLKAGKIPIGESFYLMGTVDPTGTLKRDEVSIILENGQISGKVLVYRNPGLHFGDIHVLTAVYVRALEDFIGNAKYGIFFSKKGERSVAAEIANGDFDGDMYWVSRNPQLLEYFEGTEPWERVYSMPKASHRTPNEFSAEELEHELFKQFLEAKNPCYTMAVAADSWLAHMDMLLTLGDNETEAVALASKIFQLIDIYYDAIDAPKSGEKVCLPVELKAVQYPHYMSKGDRFSYHSNSVLGQIYDHVVNFSENQKQTAAEIWKLPCFDAVLPEDCLSLWRGRYNEYRGEMTEVLQSNNEEKHESANNVIKKYKELLYGALEFHESTRNRKDIYSEALAIYHVTYDYAKTRGSVERCGFAWKVAGPALCYIYIMKQGETPMICSPSAQRKIL